MVCRRVPCPHDPADPVSRPPYAAPRRAGQVAGLTTANAAETTPKMITELPGIWADDPCT